MMRRIFIALVFLMNCVCIGAQIKLTNATVDGPFPVGKDNYPIIDGKKVKRATEVFVSTSGIPVRGLNITVPSALLQKEKVVGGYRLWLNPDKTKKKVVKLTVRTANEKITTKLGQGKKDKLKANKRYVVNLEYEGQDQNEGKAYIVVKSKKDTNVEISDNIDDRQNARSYDVKAGQSKMIQLKSNNTYWLIAKDGMNRKVDLGDKPVIVEL